MNENATGKCRLCLSEYDRSELISVFNDAESIGMSLAARIMICLSLPVQPEDSFPDCVCKNCENRITQFYAWRENCLNVYYTLLYRSTAYRAEEKYREADENSDDRDDARYSEGEKIGSCERAYYSEENTPENYHVCIAGNYEGMHGTDANSATDFGGTFVHVRATDKSENEIVFVDPQSDTRSSNASQILVDRRNEEPVIKKKLHDESDTVEESSNAVKYKCLICDKLFSDLDTASVHCTRCSRTNPNARAEKEASSFGSSQKHSKEERTSARNLEVIEKNGTNHPWKSLEPQCRVDIQINDRETGSTITNKRNLKLFFKETTSTMDKSERSKLRVSHACRYCDSVFSSVAVLRRHSAVHTGERPYECPICKKRFSKLGQLNFHKNFHDNPRYRCDVCKKPFLRPSDIAKHMRTHTGEKPYRCAVCSKSFAQLVALQQHERVHTGDKPYVCEICGKRFSQSANKTKHVKIHKEGAKPHTCAVCGKSFSDLEEMKLHRAGHGGGKPRKCVYCDESFRKMSELSQHTRRYHTFEKPHKCAFCQKAFYSLYNLKQHVMIHTGQKPYACSHCDLKFTQKGNLTKHCERKHASFANTNQQGNFRPVKIEESSTDRADEQEIWMLANDMLKNAHDALNVKSEAISEVETLNDSKL